MVILELRVSLTWLLVKSYKQKKASIEEQRTSKSVQLQVQHYSFMRTSTTCTKDFSGTK